MELRPWLPRNSPSLICRRWYYAPSWVEAARGCLVELSWHNVALRCRSQACSRISMFAREPFSLGKTPKIKNPRRGEGFRSLTSKSYYFFAFLVVFFFAAFFVVFFAAFLVAFFFAMSRSLLDEFSHLFATTSCDSLRDLKTSLRKG